MSNLNGSENKDARMALTSASDEGASQMDDEEIFVEYHPKKNNPNICDSCGQFFEVVESIGGTEKVKCLCGYSFREEVKA
jgi:hypothetical protein